MAPKVGPDAAYREKIAGSGLSVADGKRLRFAVLTRDAAAELGPTFERRGGFAIPYFELDGRPAEDGFFRFRYLDPPLGFAVQKPRRYAQPPDTPPRAYFPPLGCSWAEIAADPDRVIIITEGELKAACATKRGYPTVGLGGVYAFRSAARGFTLLPELEAFDWTARVVLICFDSDIREKTQVRQALTHLADTLLSRGAKPREIVLPDLGPEKTGLDDFLVARGDAEFDTLIELAPEYARSAALWRLSQEVAYVEDPGLLVRLETGQRITAGAFKEHAYAHLWYDEHRIDARGNPKVTPKQVAPAWLTWPHRATLRRFTYRPGEARITDELEYNLWTPSGVAPRAGSITPWRELVDHLFDGDAEKIRWFEAWAAYPLQHPGTKLLTAVLVWGIGQGTGKSLIGYTIGKLYGPNFYEVQPGQLHESFNEWASNRQLVMIDEVKGEDRRADAELIKRLITQHTVRVNEKFQPAFTVPDCINYYITSNHPDALYVEPTDRRLFVHEVMTSPKAPKFFAEFEEWRDRDGGLEALLAYFLGLDLTWFDPKAPAMMTRDKESMASMTASDLDSWVADLKREPDATLQRLGTPSPIADLWTARDLAVAYGVGRVTANGMARALKRNGILQVGGAQGLVMTRAGGVRLYALKNPEKWRRAQPRELAEHYERHFLAAPGAAERPGRRMKF